MFSEFDYCDNSIMISFRKQCEYSHIICIRYKSYSNFTSCPKDVFYSSHTNPSLNCNLVSYLVVTSLVLQSSVILPFLKSKSQLTYKIWIFLRFSFRIRFRLSIFGKKHVMLLCPVIADNGFG